MAIKISVTKADKSHALDASKFFGNPTIPMAWVDDFLDDEIFFCQIRLSDLSHLDTENLLPHKGYLYVFLGVSQGECCLRPRVLYHAGEPDLCYDDFNAAVEGYEHLTDAYVMSFSLAENNDEGEGTHLLGEVADWPYGEPCKPLLMQYDPLDGDMGFLSHIDGYLYLFFGEDTSDFSGVTAVCERS